MKTSKLYTKPVNGQVVLTALFICLFAFSINAQQYVSYLKNSGFETGDFTDWTVEVDGGDGAIVKDSAGYGYTYGLRTSWEWTDISQEIDLLALGYSASWLDESPIVRFATWVKGTGQNAADEYKIYIELRDASGTALETYDTGTLFSTADWEQVTKTFLNYPAGVRTIYMRLSGRDAEIWSGNYGVNIDAPDLSIGNLFLNASNRTRDLSGWTIDESGGDGWNANSNQSFGYQTSFYTCRKSQTINLMDLGYTAAQLDSEPRIDIWEFYLGYDGPNDGTGIGDTYFMNVELRDGSGNTIANFSSGDLTCTEMWQSSTTFFENYGSGLREIYFEHGGVDTEYWSGNYGGFIDATTMQLTFPVISGVKEIAEDNLDLVVYPNPVAPKTPIAISLNNEIQGTYQVEMADVMGRVVFQSAIEKTSTSYQTSFTPNDLATGMYMLSVRKDNFIATQRVIVR